MCYHLVGLWDKARQIILNVLPIHLVNWKEKAQNCITKSKPKAWGKGNSLLSMYVSMASVK